MSELGLLSYQYQAMAELSRQLRRHIVFVKRVYYKLPPDSDLELDETEVKKYFATILRFLNDVIELDDESIWPEQWLETAPLPTAIVERLRKAHEFDHALYVRQLSRLADRFEDSLSHITESDIGLLEDIAHAANMDTTSVFRRLMRWA